MLVFSGARLWAVRCNREVSRRVLGRAAGVTGQSIYNWEHGVGAPRADVLALLATALNVTVDDFYEERTLAES